MARDSAAVSRIRLVQEATRILRKQGYTWAGRKRNAISSGQVAFEKRLVLTPCGGRADRR